MDHKVVTCAFSEPPAAAYFAYVLPGRRAPITVPWVERADAAGLVYRAAVPTAGVRGTVAWRMWGEDEDGEVVDSQTGQFTVEGETPSAAIAKVKSIRDDVRGLAESIGALDRRLASPPAWATVVGQGAGASSVATATPAPDRGLLYLAVGTAVGLAVGAILVVCAMVAGRRG